MDNLQIYLLGFIAQGLFGGRLIIQWWQSEKNGKVVSPTLFWHLSLGGSILFLIYGLLRMDPVIVLGQFLSYFIYIRNLQLKNAWRTISILLRILILALPFFCFAFFLSVVKEYASPVAPSFSDPIIILGTVGQLALNFRFLYQWYYSEKFRTSILPFGFWSISTWASVMVIIYSLFHPLYKIEPVLLVSQSLGIVVYIRNMMLSRRIEIKNT